MKLNELLEKVGFENVNWQNLDECADTLNYSKKNGTKVTFGTEEKLDSKGTVKQGIVLWIDREILKAALANPSGGTARAA